MGPLEAAKQFVEGHFTDCIFAVLAGSVVRGESTSTSDLDIFIIREHLDQAYRASFVEFGWPIEAFIHNEESYKLYFDSDVARRRPSLVKMCSEGIVIKDTRGMEAAIKERADQLLAKGPKPFSAEESANQRYAITDLLDDLIGAEEREEQLFIVQELSERISNFILVNRGQWMGRGKWIPRLVKKLDRKLYEDLMSALEQLYRFGDKQAFIGIVLQELGQYGGALFQGYSTNAGNVGIRREQEVDSSPVDDAALFITTEPTKEETDYVRERLVQFNLERAPTAQVPSSVSINLLLKGPGERIYGGLLGRMYRFVLYVDILWIDERCRKSGFGSKLLHTIETIARERSCTMIHLDTFSFQAPDFYAKQGFELFGVLEGFPEGIKRYYYKKTID